MKRLLALLACSALAALVLAPWARPAEFGIVPGSGIGKTHIPIHLKHVKVGNGETCCAIDFEKIRELDPISQAGAHPDATGAGELAGASEFFLKDFIAETPPGFLANPTAVPACDREAFRETYSGNLANGCQPVSQVGVVSLKLPIGPDLTTRPVYRIAASPGSPASLGFQVTGTAGIVINGNLRTDGDYGLTVSATEISTGATPRFAGATFWGVPADPFHDADRFDPSTHTWGIASGMPRVPFIQTPTDCNASGLVTTIRIDSWQEPGTFLPDILAPGDPRRNDYTIPAPKPTGCEKLSFKPQITLLPSIPNSDSPTGASVQMEVPQNQDPKGLATPQLKKAVVTLPQGMSVNPAAADGIEGCSAQQIGLLTTHGAYPNPIRFAKGDANCPQAAKVGTGVVDTPLLDEPVQGDVYLATPYDNPFGTLIALYLVFRGPGFVAKIPGKVEPDPNTGQLKTTFDYSPQVAFEKLSLDFFGGPRGPLATSPLCGAQPIETELTPWSAPQSGPPATPSNSYPATEGPAGAPCSFTAAQRPFGPALTAGTDSPIAGGYSALTMRLTRSDGNQELAGLTVHPPRGFTASLRSIPYCSDAAIEVARTRTGSYEAAHPDCPAASVVGHTLVGAGAGPTPLFTGGTAYLAGPYKGAPLSMAIVTPALAGGTPGHPVFDLGTVVVRVALRLDPRTAQITAVSDPVPQTLKGIPLRIRDIRFALDRSKFGINPTSCADKSFDVSATGQSGARAALSNRFQVVECANLGFKPRLDLSLTGGTKRGNHPKLRAVLRPHSGDANIARAAVALPHSAFLDQAHIRTVCTRVQFAAHNCPQGAVYGFARAFSPLLDRPLEGPVYLRSSDNLLPDLVADLHGQVNVEAVGRIDSVNGGLRTTFDLVPDAQLSKFVLTMQGGSKGLIVNSRNLCASPSLATARYVGQNGRRYGYRPQVVAAGCK